ncbi:MAG: restriction endonuclease [Porticoccaceae bacterium]
MADKVWDTYEQVAQYLLNQFAEVFQLGSVEGKQLVAGESGTDWQIDAKGVKEGEDGFIIVECKRHTKSRVNQEIIAGLAFRIKDTGAEGGIIVTPMQLQKGAQIVASHEGIKHVRLDKASTHSNYIFQFLNQIFIGVTDNVTISGIFHAQVIRNGKIID